MALSFKQANYYVDEGFCFNSRNALKESTMRKMPQNIAKAIKRTAFLEHSKAEWQGNFTKDAKTGKNSQKTGAGLTATKMYLKAIKASFLKPEEQAREIRKWARTMQNHSIAAATEALKQGRITRKEFETAKRRIIAQTNGAIRRGFRLAGLG